MSAAEVDYAAAGYMDKYKDTWEQTRRICLAMLSTVSTKELKPTDIIKFSWDNDNTATAKTTITPEEKERILKRAGEILEKIQNQEPRAKSQETK
jgi:hypothetical protein